MREYASKTATQNGVFCNQEKCQHIKINPMIFYFINRGAFSYGGELPEETIQKTKL